MCDVAIENDRLHLIPLSDRTRPERSSRDRSCRVTNTLWGCHQKWKIRPCGLHREARKLTGARRRVRVLAGCEEIPIVDPLDNSSGPAHNVMIADVRPFFGCIPSDLDLSDHLGQTIGAFRNRGGRSAEHRPGRCLSVEGVRLPVLRVRRSPRLTSMIRCPQRCGKLVSPAPQPPVPSIPNTSSLPELRTNS
jgi:hypothetical protein